MKSTILLVEDESNDAFFLKSAFKKAGILNPVFVVAHGREALDYLQGKGAFGDRDRFPLPSLVLLDLKLPHVMGFDVLRSIRATPEIAATVVVVLTSSDSSADIAAAYDAGANAYLVKPSDIDTLLSLACAIRDFWLKANVSCPSLAAADASPRGLAAH